jgi:EAL domain-containing protein (putative c-di-GMP-specific phosphodiesterase class I)
MKILHENRLSPEHLILEITETTAMENVEESIKILSCLYQNGIQIFIDDFGSGYSSIGRLKNLPVHALKIDRFFTQHIVDDPDDAAIVMSIMAMAHGLNIRVIAEGVETEAQLEHLRSMRWSIDNPLQCDQVQGFLFSRPVTAEDFTKLFIRQNIQGKIEPDESQSKDA